MKLSDIKHFLIGRAKNPFDPGIFRHISLVALLAWVGLGADGLSSSCYGPEEAFRTLGQHTYMAILLAIVMSLTVLVIAYAYSRVIEHFPLGGGGYVVSSKLLGAPAGVVSGSALLVDYVLTITVSIAAAGDALFSFLPAEWHSFKLSVEIFLIVFLIILNLRGVKESVLALTPIFLVFVLTHLILIIGGIVIQAPSVPATLDSARQGFAGGYATLGLGGMILIFLHAYSLGGGTYTGIEAVSNGLSIMREPYVSTGRRTMLYMAISLAFTASGLLLCYLLWGVTSVEGKTMNAVFAEKFITAVPLGQVFVILVLVSEGLLLVVAAQAGFVDGPRVLSNMALDQWMPRRFASLSERLTIHNGIVLMGGAALAALLYTKGDIRQLVIMYSINVFITFSMTEISMCRLWVMERKTRPDWWKKISIHIIGGMMCLTILTVTVYEKFLEGGWLTLVITSGVIILAFVVKRHYMATKNSLKRLDDILTNVPRLENLQPISESMPTDAPTAVLMVSGYNGFGIHMFFSMEKLFPKIFKRVVFVCVGELDMGRFKGIHEVENLRINTETEMKKYVQMANDFGFHAEYRFDVSVDTIETLMTLSNQIQNEYPRSVFFASKLVFKNENIFTQILHNETAFRIQRRLALENKQTIVMPIRVY
ncbi:MAG: APC family permease [Candidatus Brocadiia bacterium]